MRPMILSHETCGGHVRRRHRLVRRWDTNRTPAGLPRPAPPSAVFTSSKPPTFARSLPVPGLDAFRRHIKRYGRWTHFKYILITELMTQLRRPNFTRFVLPKIGSKFRPSHIYAKRESYGLDSTKERLVALDSKLDRLLGGDACSKSDDDDDDEPTRRGSASSAASSTAVVEDGDVAAAPQLARDESRRHPRATVLPFATTSIGYCSTLR